MTWTRTAPRQIRMILMVVLVLAGLSPANTSLADDANRAWHGISLSIHGSMESRDDGPLYEFYSPPEIWGVERGGPAHNAGLQRGDRLISINGVLFTSPEGGRLFSRLQAGDLVEITYERDSVAYQASWIAGRRDPERSTDDDDPLRYAGSHWGSDVEVRGSDQVVVVVNRERQEILIYGESTYVRIRAAREQEQ